MNIQTTLGDMNITPIKGTVKVVTGGLWYNGDISVTFYTSENERSGVIYTYNVIKKKLVSKERIVVTYVNAQSRLKYGRKCTKETLPIYLS